VIFSQAMCGEGPGRIDWGFCSQHAALNQQPPVAFPRVVNAAPLTSSGAGVRRAE
jgi:hypothetical protein